MTPRRRAAVAALLALILWGCAPEPAVQPARAANPCREMSGLYVSAQRDSFTLAFPEAERKFRSILAIQDDQGAAVCADGASRAAVLAELGLALSSQRKFRLAEQTFAEAEASLAGAAPQDAIAVARLDLDRGRVAALRSQHALNQRDFATARVQSAAALALLEDPGAGVDRRSDLIELASEERTRRVFGLSSYFARSAAFARDGDSAAARTAIERAIEIAGALPGATGALRSRLLAEQALVELSDGRAEEAAAHAREAADQLDAELPNTPLAARARLVEAVALVRAGREDAAFEAFELAFASYGETPAELQYESIWPFVKLTLESRRDLPAEDIFRAAQLVRSSSAASDIAQAAALAGVGDDAGAAAVRSWRAAQEEVYLLTTALSRRDLQPVDRQALNRRFVEAADREASLRRTRDALAPAYRRAVEAPATLAEAQAALRPGEALLQILVGDPRSTVVLVEPDGVRVETPPINSELAGVLAAALRAPMVQGPDGRFPGFPVDIAHLVYQGLLRDLGPVIAGKDRVFVSVNGALQGAPLEMLVTQDPAPQAARVAAGDYTGVAWLGAAVQFSYLPSTRSLVDLRGLPGRAQQGGGALAFGAYAPGVDPAQGIDPGRRASCAAEIAVLRSLPPLPGTAREIDALSQAMGAQVEAVTGADFTEGGLKRLSGEGRLAQYQVLHFATHGLLWPTVDCFDPALTASSEPGGGEDGLIESAEIRALRLDADLVVLSACQSTDPDVAEAGENLSGLARAFFTSGARSVVASHWAVDDQRTADLMAALYRRLAAGATVSGALEGARAELRAAPASSHPVFWAPFVALGDGAVGLGPA